MFKHFKIRVRYAYFDAKNAIMRLLDIKFKQPLGLLAITEDGRLHIANISFKGVQLVIQDDGNILMRRYVKEAA